MKSTSRHQPNALPYLLNFRPLRAVGRISRTELWLGVLALAGVVLFDVLQGLVVAMTASILLHVYRSSRPHLSVLGRVPGTDQYAVARFHPEAAFRPGVLVIRLDAPLYYANASTVRDDVKSLVREADSPIEVVVFNPEVQFDLDVTSLEMIEQLFEWLTARGVRFFIVRPHDPALDTLHASGVIGAVGVEVNRPND